MGSRSKQGRAYYYISGIEFDASVGGFEVKYTKQSRRACADMRLGQRFNWKRERFKVCPFRKRRRRK